MTSQDDGGMIFLEGGLRFLGNLKDSYLFQLVVGRWALVRLNIFACIDLSICHHHSAPVMLPPCFLLHICCLVQDGKKTGFGVLERPETCSNSWGDWGALRIRHHEVEVWGCKGSNAWEYASFGRVYQILFDNYLSWRMSLPLILHQWFLLCIKCSTLMDIHLAKDGSRFEGEFKEDRASGLQAIIDWTKKDQKSGTYQPVAGCQNKNIK